MSRRSIALAAAASLLGLPVLAATPQQDTANIVTLQVENDAVSTLRGTSDQYYTSGLRLGWTSGTNEVPTFMQTAANQVWGDGVQRVSLDLTQSIFTPRDTQSYNPPLRDRPYAAVLGVTGSIIHDTGDARTVLGVELGVIGPAAGGKTIQNGFHDVIGDTPNKGWGTGLKNEPIFEITEQRTWRISLGSTPIPVGIGQELEFDVLPTAQLGVGLLRNYFLAGAVFRMGQGLDSDYDVSRIQPGLSGTDAYTPTRPFAWYVFAGANGQAVGTDVTLDGNNFRSSRHVGPSGTWASWSGGGRHSVRGPGDLLADVPNTGIPHPEGWPVQLRLPRRLGALLMRRRALLAGLAATPARSRRRRTASAISWSACGRRRAAPAFATPRWTRPSPASPRTRR